MMDDMKTSHWIYVNSCPTLFKEWGLGQTQEHKMSNLKYAIVEEVSTVVEEKQPRPELVPSRKGTDRALTQKVESVLDAVFANGNMPA